MTVVITLRLLWHREK